MSFQYEGSRRSVADTAPAAISRAVECRGRHTVLLSATEPLDIVGAQRLVQRMSPLMETCRCLIIDLTNAEFIDSSGVRALLKLAEELEDAGKELRLVIGRGTRVERVLKLLQLLERFQTSYAIRDACRLQPGAPNWSRCA